MMMIQILLVSTVALLFTACTSTLRVRNIEDTRQVLPWLQERLPKAAVIEKLGRSWRYTENSGRAMVYSMVEENGAIVVAPRGDAVAVFELVLIFDEQCLLHRYSLIEVK
jgi:hypothetical protein